MDQLYYYVAPTGLNVNNLFCYNHDVPPGLKKSHDILQCLYLCCLYGSEEKCRRHVMIVTNNIPKS